MWGVLAAHRQRSQASQRAAEAADTGAPAGKARALPRHAPSVLVRAVKQDCQAYLQLCSAFQEGPAAWQAAMAKPLLTQQSLQAVGLRDVPLLPPADHLSS